MAHPPPGFHLEPFLDYLNFERGLAVRSVAAYRSDLERFLAYVVARGVSRPESLDPATLRDYTFHLKDAGLAATSIRRAQSALRTYLHLNANYLARLEPGASSWSQRFSAEVRAVF